MWLILLVFFLSCQSVPKTPDIFLNTHLPLEDGAYVYLLANKDALPVLNQLGFANIDNKQFEQMVDWTQFIAAAVYVAPNSHYRLAAWGSYPASRAKIALGASKEWKKRRSAVSGADYWYSPQGGLSIAITPAMALVATAAIKDGANAGDTPNSLIDPFSAAPGTPLPEGFSTFREGAILSCWLADPGPAINQKIKEMKIPLEIPAEQLFVGLLPAGEEETGGVSMVDAQRYVARLQIQVASETQARALAMMLALARNFISPPKSANSPSALLLSVLFAKAPAQDGKNLVIATDPLSAREIALLLKNFSL